MKNKYFTLIITFALVLCFFCASVTVLAAPDEETGGDTVLVPGDSITVTTPQETNNSNREPVIETEKQTETEDDGTTTTTRRKENTTTTTRRHTSSNAVTRKETTTASSKETTLANGQFYVYLVLGNGEKDLKTLMKEKGLVTAPAEPVWEGHIFEGWYSDAEFTEKWDFSKDIAEKEMTVYAKWSEDNSTHEYKISVSDTVGGTISVSPAAAVEGTPIIITVKPESGKRLVSGSLTINGEKSDFLSFNMPAEDVIISAEFELIPAKVEKEESDKTLLYLIVCGVVLGAVLVAVGIILIRRNRGQIIVPEFDENGAVIIEDNEEAWIDETLVVEDAYPNAKKSTGKSDADGATSDTSQESAAKTDVGITRQNTEGEGSASYSPEEKPADAISDNDGVSQSDLEDMDFSMFEE